MSRFGIWKIGGVEYDLDDLTLDEMEAIEEGCGGLPFSDLNFGSAKTMKVITLTLLRRRQPDATLDDVGSIKMLDLMPADEEMPPLPPAAGAGEPNGSALAASGLQPSPASTAG
jgi:hypothetical protein